MDDVVRKGTLVRVGKMKVKVWARKKVGVVGVTCALLPEEIRVITVNIGGERGR